MILFGFALMLTMTGVGMLALFNFTAILPAKVSGAPATVAITGTLVTVDPNDPGALTQMEVRFTTRPNKHLGVGSDG
jgi:hypothetical protein